jgi:hypothetical protein
VLANVAYIIIEESEEGEIRRNWWKEVFISSTSSAAERSSFQS